MTVLLIEHGASRRSKKWSRNYRRWFERQQNPQTLLTLTTSAERGVDILQLHSMLERANEIVLLAGDGTLHWLVNQLTEEQAQRLIISVVPCGTGNDFARDVGLTKPDWRMSEDEQLQLRRVDVADINGTRFVNAASLGLTVDLVRDQSVQIKYWLGRVSYVVGLLGWWFGYRYDRGTTPILSSILVGRYLGGGLKLAPGANREDGMLVRVAVKPAPKLQLLGLLWAVLRGVHSDHPLITTEQAERFVIGPDTLEIDGELQRLDTQAECVVRRKFLRIRVVGT